MLTGGRCPMCKREVPIIPGWDIPNGVEVIHHHDLIAHATDVGIPCNAMSINTFDDYSSRVWSDDELWEEILNG